MKKIIFTFFMFCCLHLVGANIEWNFPASPLSTVGQSAEDPKIAIDFSGNAVAIWIENGVVKSKTKLANMGWSMLADTLSDFGSSSASIVLDSYGNATVVWLENEVVKAASKTLNGAWSSPSTLSKSKAEAPCLAMNDDGDIIVAWARKGDIQTSTRCFGGSWENEVTINASGSASPHISIGGTGVNKRATVAWQAVKNSKNVVYAATKLLSKNKWKNKEILSDENHQAGFASTAVDSEGTSTVVWFAYDALGANHTRVLVQSASKLADGLWSDFSTLSSGGIGNPNHLVLQVSYDASGNAIAFWNTTFDNETYSIQSAVKPALKSWSSPIDLVTGNLYALDANIAIASGKAFALYMFYNGLDLVMQSSEVDLTGFMNPLWSLPLSLSEDDASAASFIAARVDGNVIHTAAVWLGSKGTYNSALATTGTKTLVLPPLNPMVSEGENNFGVFTEYFNTVSWDQSLDSTVTGYLIYRDGVFLERVDASVLQYVDHNRVQGEPAVYGISAVDTQDSRSQIAVIQFP